MIRPINIAGNAINKEKELMPITLILYSPTNTTPKIMRTSAKTSPECSLDELIFYSHLKSFYPL
jgi:hypothetical protein|tara:strand:+ start:1561 stop:1752 length:192 start_codon:yes stop_codon:yes gene_type:complete